MILLFGGTTEGREAAARFEEAGLPYLYSTKQCGTAMPKPMRFGEARNGALDLDRMILLCRDRGIGVIVDAAHPFASGLHTTIAAAAEAQDLPVVRYERAGLCREEPAGAGRVIFADSFDDARTLLERGPYRRVLAFTGVQSIARFRSVRDRCGMLFRILPRESSVEIAAGEGFPTERLLPMHPSGSVVAEATLIRECGADCILVKESGENGFLSVKLDAAAACGVPAVVIRRPPLPAIFRVAGSGAEVLAMVQSLAGQP